MSRAPGRAVQAEVEVKVKQHEKRAQRMAACPTRFKYSYLIVSSSTLETIIQLMVIKRTSFAKY
jgi:hypothetical protein